MYVPGSYADIMLHIAHTYTYTYLNERLHGCQLFPGLPLVVGVDQRLGESHGNTILVKQQPIGHHVHVGVEAGMLPQCLQKSVWQWKKDTA